MKAREKLRKMKDVLVKVTWDDAHIGTSPDHNPLETYDVGWVLNVDRKGVTLAGGNTRYYGYTKPFTFIPMQLVRRVKILEY